MLCSESETGIKKTIENADQLLRELKQIHETKKGKVEEKQSQLHKLQNSRRKYYYEIDHMHNNIRIINEQITKEEDEIQNYVSTTAHGGFCFMISRPECSRRRIKQ